MSVLFIYDETSGVPDAVRRIIGADRFGDIVRRKQRLADSIQAVVQANSDGEFYRLLDEGQLPELVERIQKLPSEASLFRLPASVVPLSAEIFGALIGKLRFALDEVIYGEPNMLDPPALLHRDSALALLGEREPSGRRLFFNYFETKAVRVGNQAQLVDITDISSFLAFMAGAAEARHFNSVSHSAGILCKHSQDREKMLGEYRYYHIADEAMKRFLLPTFDYTEDSDGATYAMEHLSVPDAAMQFVHNTFSEASFTCFMDSFFAFIDSRGRKVVGIDEVRRIGQLTIIDKLNLRMEKLRVSPVGNQLTDVLRSLSPHGSLDHMADRCRQILCVELQCCPIDFLAIGHGDPCFSNILYNAEINLFRLIDPRGALDREQAFAHPLYDLAKFSHSVLGSYDFVNGGLAECKIDSKLQLALVLERGGSPAWMKRIFRAKLAALGWDVRLVRAIEASLFLSMLPLHIDSPEKLPAFCLIAGEILSELEYAA
jgi:hypothetical protein